MEVTGFVSKGLVSCTWGSVSIGIDDIFMVITPSGRKYEDLTVNDIVIVNILINMREI